MVADGGHESSLIHPGGGGEGGPGICIFITVRYFVGLLCCIYEALDGLN